jgi:hypothetical protein
VGTLDPAQDRMLDGVEANSTASDCFTHGGSYVLDPERLYKP